MRHVSTILASLAVLAAAGCSVEAEDLSVGSVDQQIINNTNAYGQSCSYNAVTNMLAAGLAVAAGQELGRWQGLTDFARGTVTVVTQWGSWNMGALVLSDTGKARCAARGGCPQIEAILSLQADRSLVGGNDVFASRLVAGYDSLKADTDARRCSSAGVTTTFLGSIPAPLSCGGLEFDFRVSSTDPKVSACQMTLFDGGGTVRTVTPDGMTYLTDNPFITFTVTGDTTVRIDPTDSTTAGTTSSTLSCWDGTTGLVYDRTPKTKVGQCCYRDGMTKTLYPYNTAWDRCL